MPGARCTRGLVCQTVRRKAHTSIQVSGNTPTSPAQRLYGLLRALPGGAGLLSPSPLRSLLPKSLAPASRRQDHTTSPYAAEHSPLKRCVHRIPRPTCRDDGDTPLWWARDGDSYTSDFQKCKAIFLRGGWDNPNQLEIAQEIRFAMDEIREKPLIVPLYQLEGNAL